jgi:DnaJ-class molecular chaperone
LADAFGGVSTTVRTLDGRSLPVNCPYATPQTVLTVPGEGMLNRKQKTKGVLKIKFDIEFPSNISLDKRNQICAILRG